MPYRSDLTFRTLGARNLRKQAKQLVAQIREVQVGNDIESIHQARVASRRLRVALKVFGECWKPKLVKRWKEQVRRLTQELGEARDRDVQIEFLTESLALVSEKRLVPGIARLLNQIERQREWLQPRIRKAVDRLEKSGVLRSIRTTCRGVLSKQNISPAIYGEDARRHTARQIQKRLKALLHCETSLADDEQHQRHHAMRIAAKRLRYSMELAKPIFGGPVAATIEATKKVQSLLGEIHDCDVWREHLDEFDSQEANRVRVHAGESRHYERLRPGIDHLRTERQACRSARFAELVRYWGELREQGLWDRLNAIVEWGDGSTPVEAVVDAR